MNDSQPDWDANNKEKQRKAVQQDCADWYCTQVLRDAVFSYLDAGKDRK